MQGKPETIIACVRSRLKSYLEEQPLSEWIKAKVVNGVEPFYTSIDIRDAGFKLAPVDANLFPAGFNNICPEDLFHSAPIARRVLVNHLGRIPKNIVILPESHTKNRYYVDNLLALKQIFENLGIEVRIGWWGELPSDVTIERNQVKAVRLSASNGTELLAHPLELKNDALTIRDLENGSEIVPEFILVNNDFSSGFPFKLTCTSQPIEPSFRLGWHTRKKHEFFEHYNHLVGELAKNSGVDPWHLQVDTELVQNVNFDEAQGLDRIAEAAEKVLTRMKAEYEKRGIVEKPFVFVKSNSGTYGMGILKIENAEELRTLNRRDRNKMHVVKNKLVVSDVIVQEGIPTRLQPDGVFAEPVIYSLGAELLGGFLRKNPTRGRVDNLNAKGMVFQKLCMTDLRRDADRDLSLELVYGTIASLSVAAVSLEIAQHGSPLRMLPNIDNSIDHERLNQNTRQHTANAGTHPISPS